MYGNSRDTICGWECESPYGNLAAGEYDRVKWGWPMVDRRWLVRPDSVYGVAKVFGETKGRVDADKQDLSVIVILLRGVRMPDGPVLRRHYPG